MKIGIIGCGWLGERVAKKLSEENEIFAVVRSDESMQNLAKFDYHLFQIDFENETDSKTAHLFKNLDVIIISLPVSKKHFSQNIFNNVSKFLENYQKPIIVFSSVGIYPQENGIYTEENIESLNENIFATENFYKKTFPQINILRFGGLMGDGRKFSNFFKNKPIPEPNDPVNHIHYLDIAEIVDLLIKNKTQGKLYNVVAPLHPTKQQVLDFQNEQINTEVKETTQGRLVLGTLLEKELNYSFLKPNPMEF